MPVISEDWQYSHTPAVAGTQAIVVVPAANGVSRILTSIVAGLQSSVVGVYGVFLEVLDGPTVKMQWAMSFDVAAAGTAAEDRQDFDLALTCLPANACTVRFSAGIANVIEQIIVKGHDA